MKSKIDKKLDAIDGAEINFPNADVRIHHVCCDCGLTHDVEVCKGALGGFKLKFKRNNRSTSQFRRHLKGLGEWA